ncbi:MAG: hypothetical protein FWE34_09030, partial [Defluviitaleaceae bacterium]|nr:hypothetical protein [Defluviitaleaceae bacterium]
FFELYFSIKNTFFCWLFWSLTNKPELGYNYLRPKGCVVLVRWVGTPGKRTSTLLFALILL